MEPHRLTIFHILCEIKLLQKNHSFHVDPIFDQDLVQDGSTQIKDFLREINENLKFQKYVIIALKYFNVLFREFKDLYVKSY